MTENNAAQPGLTDADLMYLEHQVQRDIPRFGPNVHIGVRAGVLRAMLSKLRAEGVQAGEPVGELRIGVSVTGKDATVCIVQPHRDGSVTAIYSETHPLGDSLGRTALASAPVDGERATPQPKAANQYHTLKTDPEVFQAVLSGAKTFEIRLNDRGYAVGDVLGLRETKHTGAEMRAGAPLVYTGRECQRFVSHVLTGYGLADGWCCLSFEPPHAGGESAPVAGAAQVVAWTWEDEMPDPPYAGGKIRRFATHKSTGPQDRQRPLVYGDAALQASEAARNQVLEEAAVIAENSYADAHIRIRALKTQADKDGGDCAKGAGNSRAFWPDPSIPVPAAGGKRPAILWTAHGPTQPTEQGERDA